MGPLTGTKIVEFAGLGPGPFCGLILADMGAEVIVIDRIENYGKEKKNDLASRGKKSIAIDLKNPNSKELVNELIKDADAVLEGLRPGKMENLGFGPDDLLKINPKLIYGRMTGWGQTWIHGNQRYPSCTAFKFSWRFWWRRHAFGFRNLRGIS